jgi:hypothetical protein
MMYAPGREWPTMCTKTNNIKFAAANAKTLPKTNIKAVEQLLFCGNQPSSLQHTEYVAHIEFEVVIQCYTVYLPGGRPYKGLYCRAD